MIVEKKYFNADDGLELFGLLHKKTLKNSNKVVIATHGMGSNGLKIRENIFAEQYTKNGIDFFTYNNRGYGLINAVRSGKTKFLQGTVFEDVEDSYFDVVGAIKLMIEEGYEEIYLQGHSLGSTKTVYTYNKLIENHEDYILKRIKAIMLLSLVDLTDVMNLLVKNNDSDIVKIALEKEQSKDFDYVMTTNSPFMPFVSVKTFLRYYRDNKNIDFAKYTTENFEFETLNKIEVPIFMRWGNVNELISLEADKLAKLLTAKLKGSNDIGFIDGATHNYMGKEEELADQLVSFVKK